MKITRIKVGLELECLSTKGQAQVYHKPGQLIHTPNYKDFPLPISIIFILHLKMASNMCIIHADFNANKLLQAQ